MTCQTLNSPPQRVILRPRFKANARTIKSTPRPWATKPKKTKAPARKSRHTRQLAMLTSNSRNNRNQKRGPRASFCLPAAAFLWLGRGGCYRQSRTLAAERLQPALRLSSALSVYGGLNVGKSWQKLAKDRRKMPEGLLLSALFWLGRGGCSRQS